MIFETFSYYGEELVVTGKGKDIVVAYSPVDFDVQVLDIDVYLESSVSRMDTRHLKGEVKNNVFKCFELHKAHNYDQLLNSDK